MTTANAKSAGKIGPEHQMRPYRPSWFDRIVSWFEDLPGPAWMSYTAITLLAVVMNHVPRWAEGSVPFGIFDPARVFEVPLMLFYLPATTYLNRVAKKAMEDFRPLLNNPEPTFLRLQFELTTLPRKTGWFTAILGILVGPSSVIANPITWGLTASSARYTFAYSILVSFALTALALSFLVRIIRMLRMVERIQKMAEKISLFHTGPVYAFSALTSRAGIGIIALIYYYVFIVYTLGIYGPNPSRTVIDYLTFGTLLLTGVAAFIVPLNGMHRRLAREKTDRLAEVNARIELTIARLHREVDEDDITRADGINKLLTSLLAEEQALSKISTWPWKPETLRGVLSALILPIVIWLITTLLGRVLPG